VHRGQDFDESCDVYALAVVLWELVTLAFPFHDKPPQAIPGRRNILLSNCLLNTKQKVNVNYVSQYFRCQGFQALLHFQFHITSKPLNTFFGIMQKIGAAIKMMLLCCRNCGLGSRETINAISRGICAAKGAPCIRYLDNA
jgi:hypothetical protein